MPPKRKSTEAPSADAQKRAKSAQDTPAHLALGLPRNLRLTPGSASAETDVAWVTLMQDPAKAFEYIPLAPTHYGSKRDPLDEGDESEDSDEDEDGEDGEKDKDEAHPDGSKPSDENPDQEWVITYAGFQKCVSAQRLSIPRDPDEMTMYTFNDHYAYGTLELVENFMLDFQAAGLAESGWKEQWALCEGLGLFIRHGSADAMMQIDHGECAVAMSKLVKTMFLSMLATLERNRVLKPDSEIKNLGHMMALWLRLAEEPCSIFSEIRESDGTRRLASIIMAYAMKYDIALPNPGNLDSIKAIVEPRAKKVKLPAPESKKNDPWDWNKSLKSYVGKFEVPAFAFAPGPVGGDKLDVTSWTSERRKKYAFDKKDPLTEEMIKDLSGKPPSPA